MLLFAFCVFVLTIKLLFFSLKAITSSNLGEMYRLLHGSEFDFGTTSTMVAGAIVYGTERSVNWFLMTRPEVPTHCEISDRCLLSEQSDSGFVEFHASHIRLNTLYYICASSNVAYIERETFTERLEAISACSDGFVLDDTPPYGGEIHVQHHNGYISDTSHVLVSWDGFKDNIDAKKLHYSDGIRSYSFGVGMLKLFMLPFAYGRTMYLLL